MYKIVETDEYQTLTYFFYENGLEITPGAEKSAHVIKSWECRDPVTGRLIGGAALEIRDGEFVVADLAVDVEHRNEDLGTRLMEVVEAEIVKQGGKSAWLVGKVPGFYYKLGWQGVTREEAPDISHCFSCAKFGQECNPRVMRKSFL